MKYFIIYTHALSASQRDQFRAQHIGVIFQQFNLIPYLNILDNIKLAAHFSLYSPAQANETMSYIIDRLSLSQRTLQQRLLSVGQQQRVAIARALINQPSIIIADEPTSALDSDAKDDFIQLLFESTHQIGSTILFVSHDQSLAKHFERRIQLNDINHPIYPASI